MTFRNLNDIKLPFKSKKTFQMEQVSSDPLNFLRKLKQRLENPNIRTHQYEENAMMVLQILYTSESTILRDELISKLGKRRFSTTLTYINQNFEKFIESERGDVDGERIVKYSLSKSGRAVLEEFFQDENH